MNSPLTPNSSGVLLPVNATPPADARGVVPEAATLGATTSDEVVIVRATCGGLAAWEEPWPPPPERNGLPPPEPAAELPLPPAPPGSTGRTGVARAATRIAASIARCQLTHGRTACNDLAAGSVPPKLDERMATFGPCERFDLDQPV
jgi:hypothetical protein